MPPRTRAPGKKRPVRRARGPAGWGGRAGRHRAATGRGAPARSSAIDALPAAPPGGPVVGNLLRHPHGVPRLPVVADRLARRWLLAHLAVPDLPRRPRHVSRPAAALARLRGL